MTKANITVRNPNHPRKGSSIKVAPITDLQAIERIKYALRSNPRDLCLFTFGINTAYRANELVSIKVGQVAHLNAGDRLELKQSKNGKYRAATLNENVIKALRSWLRFHPEPEPDAPLFRSFKTREALTATTLTAMVKSWCALVDLDGNFGSHTLRKTWGYHQRKTFNQPTALLSVAFGHSSERQTMDYLCIQPTEIEHLYTGAL